MLSSVSCLYEALHLQSTFTSTPGSCLSPSYQPAGELGQGANVRLTGKPQKLGE